MHKKATLGNMTMAFTFLFLIFIISVGLLAGIYIFYGSGYDFRETESSLLSYKIKNCILKSSLDADFFNKENFYENCALNKETIEKNNIIKICKGDSCIDSTTPLFSSGSNFQSCLFEGAKENKNYPQCSIISIKKQSETYQIITGSSQFSRREQT